MSANRLWCGNLTKKHSLTPWEPTQWLKGNFQITANGRAGGLCLRTGSFTGHPSGACCCLILLDFCYDKRRTRCTVSLDK
ncbi:hypothetical protein J6590_011192 [Homalodisca vitripennis]|nr:hypothetical protein J6590_011192 [Homalodisca vitripennis]